MFSNAKSALAVWLAKLIR